MEKQKLFLFSFKKKMMMHLKRSRDVHYQIISFKESNGQFLKQNTTTQQSKRKTRFSCNYVS